MTKSDGFYFWLNNLSLQLYLFSNGLGFLDAQLKENLKKGLRRMQSYEDISVHLKKIN